MSTHSSAKTITINKLPSIEINQKAVLLLLLQYIVYLQDTCMLYTRQKPYNYIFKIIKSDAIIIATVTRYVLPLGSSMYPSGQSQRYVPTSFEQNPTPQTSGFSSHSFTSKRHGQRQKRYNYTSAHGVRSARASYVTITECTGVVETVTFVAWTHVTPERVGTVAVCAQVVVFLAFVDVFEYHLYHWFAAKTQKWISIYPKYMFIKCIVSYNTANHNNSKIINRHSILWFTVVGFGLYPVPPGQSVLYSSVSTPGHDSHLEPHALPTEQQHVAFDTADPISWWQILWPPRSSTSM